MRGFWCCVHRRWHRVVDHAVSVLGVRSFEWLLLMPLAIPAYVGAYALVDLLEYAGPVQSALRGVMG